MAMIVLSAAAGAVALNAGFPIEGAFTPEATAQCVLEPAWTVDTRVGPLLVAAPEERPVGSVSLPGQWGQAALRPYDVMSSLGAGHVPAVPQALSFADAPVPLRVTNPLAGILAGAGLLAMLYIRRTRH